MNYIRNKLLNKLSKNDLSILINVINSFVIKGGSLLISLIIMPLYIDFFNNHFILGLWFTILSFLSWILNFDLGIGNGLRNHLTIALSNKNIKEAKKYVSSAYLSVIVLIAIISIIFIIIEPNINWTVVFNVDNSDISLVYLSTTVKIVFLGIMIQFVLKLVTSILYAIQLSFITNLLTFFSQLFLLVFVYLCPSSTNSINLIVMALANAIAVIVPLLVTTLILFLSKLKRIRPSFLYFRWSYAKKVLSLGGTFFFVQIAYMVIMSTNEYLITLFMGSEYVVEYQVYFKLFSIIGTVYTLTLTPIWSAITKAYAEKNYKWIKKIYNLCIRFSILGVIVEFLIIPFLPFFISFWLGQGYSFTINYFYCIQFSLLGSLMILNSVFSCLANGLGELKTQVLFFGIGSVIKVPLSYILIIMTGSWIGVVIGNVITLSLYCIVQPFWIKKKIIVLEEYCE